MRLSVSLRTCVLELGYVYLSGLPKMKDPTAPIHGSTATWLDDDNVVHIARAAQRILTFGINVGTGLPD